jgi:hypothetical protein
MDRNAEQLLADFQACYTAAERDALLRASVAQAVWEAPCAECGKYVFAVTRQAGWSCFECPACHTLTWIGRGADGGLAVLGAARRKRLLRAAARRQWFCPEHDGVRVKVTGIDTDPADPAAIGVRYACRRWRGLFQGARTHTGAIAANLLALVDGG